MRITNAGKSTRTHTHTCTQGERRVSEWESVSETKAKPQSLCNACRRAEAEAQPGRQAVVQPTAASKVTATATSPLQLSLNLANISCVLFFLFVAFVFCCWRTALIHSHTRCKAASTICIIRMQRCSDVSCNAVRIWLRRACKMAAKDFVLSTLLIDKIQSIYFFCLLSQKF